MKLTLKLNKATGKWEVVSGKRVLIVSKDKALLKEWCKESNIKI